MLQSKIVLKTYLIFYLSPELWIFSLSLVLSKYNVFGQTILACASGLAPSNSFIAFIAHHLLESNENLRSKSFGFARFGSERPLIQECRSPYFNRAYAIQRPFKIEMAHLLKRFGNTTLQKIISSNLTKHFFIKFFSITLQMFMYYVA